MSDDPSPEAGRPTLPLSTDQAMEWALRIGERMKSDVQRRGPRFWGEILGLNHEQVEQVMEYFEEPARPAVGEEVPQ